MSEFADPVSQGAVADDGNGFDAAPMSVSGAAWRRFRANRLAWFSGWYLFALVSFVILWPATLALMSRANPGAAAFAAAHDPNELSDDIFQTPGVRHWFGTDDHGRDLFSRVIYGARISLTVGLVGSAVSLVIGVLWGAVAGYVGGRLDGLMMRVVDILYSLPSIIFVIVLLTTLGQWMKGSAFVERFPALSNHAHLLLLFVGLGAVSWLTMARIVRGQVLSLRTRPFVEASRALGAGPMRILSRHILPNVFGVVIVYLTLTVPGVILYESFLSFLGLGIQPPMASWGSLIAQGVAQINPIRVYWWMLAFPGAILVLTLLAINFVGDGLRDAWNVREK